MTYLGQLIQRVSSLKAAWLGYVRLTFVMNVDSTLCKSYENIYTDLEDTVLKWIDLILLKTTLKFTRLWKLVIYCITLWNKSNVAPLRLVLTLLVFYELTKPLWIMTHLCVFASQCFHENTKPPTSYYHNRLSSLLTHCKHKRDPSHRNRPVVTINENWVLISMVKSYLLALI